MNEKGIPSFDKICWNDVNENCKRYLGKLIGEGRHRKVYDDNSPGSVVKVPTKESGIAANLQEANESGSYEHLAKAKIDLDLSLLIGVPVLRMERVEHVGFSEEADWTWCIDGGQVGRAADGRIVAYDWDRF